LAAQAPGITQDAVDAAAAAWKEQYKDDYAPYLVGL
jgi:hypothetical protein